MTTTWGGTSIPDPTTWTATDELVGAQYLTADGALNTDSIATRLRISVRWELITAAQRDTLKTKAITNSSATLVLPSSDSYSVLPLRNTWTATPVGGVSALWNVSCDLRTTS
jgi:hypothetical protein